MTNRAAATAPKATTGEQAINAALAAGFEITRHLPDPRTGIHYHEMQHQDGRALTVVTALGTGRLVVLNGRNRGMWNTRRLSCRSVPAVVRLLAGTAAAR